MTRISGAVHAKLHGTNAVGDWPISVVLIDLSHKWVQVSMH